MLRTNLNITLRYGVFEMNDIRFFYNPITKRFINIGDNDHALYWHNKKHDIKLFDKEIRGIISNNILYLRLYYPLTNINDITLAEMKEYSLITLIDNNKDILKKLNGEGIKRIKKTYYNIVNADIIGKVTNI